ncbi:succinylglutamate desuccinylase [Cetobacterium sp.]|uniref:succinylglutamate desuccinylase n=1 Tax=Cetobacterium sp. TaxID=2071632 RepID=UPI003AF18C3B
MKGDKITGAILLACSLLIAFMAGKEFKKMREPEPIVKGEGVSEVKMLSEYFSGIKGTNMDTEVYVLKGKEAGGNVLILGGTHANEPAALITTVLLIENAKIDKGNLFIIPRANNSGISHNDPQEASPQRFKIKTKNGEREFRYGSRATNPLDQWPDPDVYIHASSGQQLSGNETRNLNRAYPGRPDGTPTEKAAYGIVQLIKNEKIDMTLDLHEASPEYPVINAIVAHEHAMGLASNAVIGLELEGIQIGLEPSPHNLRGLTHRELGDFTDTYALLAETANPSQGRLRGKTNEALVIKGVDPTYVKAQKLGRLFVPFDENGHPLNERVSRHMGTALELIKVMSEDEPSKEVIVKNVPTVSDIRENGIGRYLKEVISN